MSDAFATQSRMSWQGPVSLALKMFICTHLVMIMKLRYELFKLCKSKPLLIFFVLCISVYCVICALARPDLSEYPFDTRLYRMYAEKYSGEFSQSTLDKMNSELEQLSGQAQVSLENKALSAEESGTSLAGLSKTQGNKARCHAFNCRRGRT